MNSPSLPVPSAATRGMTLVEVLAVVVILGLLAGTLAVSFSGSFGKAKQEIAKTGIGQIVQKVELYRVDRGEWPSNEQGLRVLTEGLATPSSPYFLEPDQLLDPWGRPFLYVTPGPDLRPYEILTYGADGQPGGSDEAADVSSTQLRGSSS